MLDNDKDGGGGSGFIGGNNDETNCGPSKVDTINSSNEQHDANDRVFISNSTIRRRQPSQEYSSQPQVYE